MNTCVYINKKIEFCGGCVRCQVYEMWSQGDRVACGVITDDTKVINVKFFYLLYCKFLYNVRASESFSNLKIVIFLLETKTIHNLS